MTRRVWIGSLSSILIAGCSLPPGSASPTAEFRGDPAHSGRYAGLGSGEFGGLYWRTSLQGAIKATPVIIGDLVIAGTTLGVVAAVDRQTGRVRWRYDAGSAVGSVAVSGSLVIFSTGDGRVHGVDLADGRRRWETEPVAEHPFPWGNESGDVYLSSPVVVGNSIVVGRPDGSVVRVRLRDGRIEWVATTDGRVRSSPAFGGGVVYVGSADGSVYAFDAETGRRIWRFDTLGRSLESKNFGYDRRTVQSSPSLDSTTVYIGARDGFLYAIDRASGKLRWSFDHKISWVNASPALADGLVIAGTSDGHFISAVDAATGRERWRHPTGWTVWSSQAVVDSTVFATDGDGTLFALDLATGVERWKYRLPSGTQSSPVVSDSLLAVGAEDGGLYAVHLTSGRPLVRAVFWESTLADQAQFAPQELVRRFLTARGYLLVGKDSLPALLDGATAGRTVVVFAMDVLPPSVLDSAGGAASVRRFLDRGGSIVWLGLPPLIWPYDAKQGGRELQQVNRRGPESLLGVSHRPANFDAIAARVTEAGEAVGLSGWMPANWAADTTGVVVLARDANGHAAAWYRNLGGPPGTGFTRLLPGVFRDGLSPENLRAVQVAGEVRRFAGARVVGERSASTR